MFLLKAAIIEEGRGSITSFHDREEARDETTGHSLQYGQLVEFRYYSLMARDTEGNVVELNYGMLPCENFEITKALVEQMFKKAQSVFLSKLKEKHIFDFSQVR